MPGHLVPMAFQQRFLFFDVPVRALVHLCQFLCADLCRDYRVLLGFYDCIAYSVHDVVRAVLRRKQCLVGLTLTLECLFQAAVNAVQFRFEIFYPVQDVAQLRDLDLATVKLEVQLLHRLPESVERSGKG